MTINSVLTSAVTREIARSDIDPSMPGTSRMASRLSSASSNIHAGIHCASPAYAARMIHSGFRLVTIANDSGLMAKAAREAVTGVWAEAGDFR